MTLFVLVVLVGRLKLLRRGCPSRVTWWALSLPLAASAIGALKFATFDPNWFTKGIAWALLTLATLTIAGLLIRTIVGIARGELRTLSTP